MKKRTSKSSKAGIIFPVSRIKRYVKRKTKLRISYLVPIYLASVLEYLCAEILELAGLAAHQNRKQRIIPRHIFVVVAMDSELKELLKTVIIPQGGVMPYIHPNLLPKQIKVSTSDLKNATFSESAYAFLAPSKAKTEWKPKRKERTSTKISSAKKIVSPSDTESSEQEKSNMYLANSQIPDVRRLWEEQMYLGPKLILAQGNFLRIFVDAIVNPTDANFSLNSFIGWKLQSDDGELIKTIEHLKSTIGSLKPLDAVIHTSTKTIVKHIIHCFGPSSDDDEQARKLDELVEKCLSLADSKNVKSLAIPILELSYLPDEQAIHVVLRAVTNYFLSITCTTLTELYFILHEMCNCNSCKNFPAILKELEKRSE